MNIQGFQKLTLLDFPGHIACTVFTGGCNLRCPFCHNAGLVKTPTEFSSNEQEVFKYLNQRRGIIEGVVCTGGEPLLQPDLEDFLKRVKEMGYLVKLDTNGSLPLRLEKILKDNLADYVAMDIKASPKNYSLAVGSQVDFEQFEKSIAVIKNSGIPHEFRTTAVKGIHSEADFEEISRIIGDEPYFIQRFVDSGNILGEGCSQFSEDEMRSLLNLVKINTPQAQLRGQEN